MPHSQTLVELYMKHSEKGKQVQGDEFEAHFNTQTTDIGCSKHVLTEHEYEKIPPQLDNLDSTDNRKNRLHTEIHNVNNEEYLLITKDKWLWQSNYSFLIDWIILHIHQTRT